MIAPTSNTIRIKFPRPYPLQRSIIDDPAKRKVVSFGRRAGKTTAAGLASAEGLLRGERVLLTSTTQDQADIFWRYITNWFAPLFNTGVLYKNETKRILRLRDGEIRVKTGRHADALRGDGLNMLIIDEAAYLDPRAWDEVGAPMLADTDGIAWFISTPKRRNHFFQWHQKANSDERWKSWSASSHINPHLTRKALEALAFDMTEEAYKQEILAEFLEGQGAVFRYVDDRATEQRGGYEPTHEYVFGVDWGQKDDFTVITVIDQTTKRMVDYERFNQMDFMVQRQRIMTFYEKWKPYYIIVETNSIGQPNFEALQREGLPVIGFETTAKSKPPLIESLVLAFDRDEIRVLDDNILKGELMAYERNVSATTGRSAYSAPSGLHDDMVMSLALAWHGASRPVMGSIVYA